MGWSALAALPNFSSRVLSASAVVAYVAVGAAQTAMTKALPFKVIMV